MYIYGIISDSYNKKDTNLIKIGSTTNIKCRKFDLQTSVPHKLKYKWYIEIKTKISDKELIKIEHDIHFVLKKYHYYKEGGTEFFIDIPDNQLLDIIKIFLKKNSITYEIYYDDITERPSVEDYFKYKISQI
jgi:hypothetical protein